MVAASLTDLTHGTIHGTIAYDEDGLPIQGRTWTGTLPDGTGGGAYCEDWASGLAGDSVIRGDLQITSDGRWTDEEINFCNASLSHIYCFEK